MGKLSGPNALIRQNDVRKFPVLPSTPKDARCRALNQEEKTELAELHNEVLVDSGQNS